MIRSAASITISAALFAVFVSASACSSDSVDGQEKGGTGAVIGGAGGTSNAGTANAQGGTSSATAGTTGMAGTDTGLCAGKVRKCVDAATLQACNPTTGEDMTVNCAQEFAKDGLVSNGCTDDAEGIGCTLDGLSDQACADGTGPFGTCGGFTQDELLDIYVACFHDQNGAHTVIPCFSDFVDATDPANKTIDCTAAEAACLPDETGAGGAGPETGAGGVSGVGAGGAP